MLLPLTKSTRLMTPCKQPFFLYEWYYLLNIFFLLYIFCHILVCLVCVGQLLSRSLQESRAHRIKAKLLSFWEWMGDPRGFGKPKTFQTKYFLWRILIWLLSNTTCIAGCQAFRTSLAGRLIEAKSQVNLNQFSKHMRGIEPQFNFLNFER